MKYSLFSLILILFFSCQKKRNENIQPELKLKKDTEIIQVDKVNQKALELEKKEITFNTLNIFPKDTIIKSWHLTFKQISPSEFEMSSNRKQIQTSFPLDDTNDFLTKKDTCFYVTYNSKEKDTLCNFDDGEYYEKYSLKGYSSKTKTLIFDWRNWEEAHSVVINLNEKKHWILGPEYEISPNRNKLVTYSNYIDHPIYEENELFIYELTDKSVNQIFRFSNENYGVFETIWIDINTILIKLKKVDFENFEATDSYFFEMKMLNNNKFN